MSNNNAQTIRQILGRNPIHPFPARMAPGIALEALGITSSRLRVLDPMAGSGTVLAVAAANGHEAIGFDLDPLAVLLSKVWTKAIDAQTVTKTAHHVLAKAKRNLPSISQSRAYPAKSDEETKKFIRYWFDDYSRKQLSGLAVAINGVKDNSVKEVLWCAFSRLIITKSVGVSLAMDLSHSRPHRVYDRAPVKPFNRFLSAVEIVISNCPRGQVCLLNQISVNQGDARMLKLPPNSIDLVLTSPPYLHAIDYMRCSKFSLVWMGYNISDLRKIRSASIGSESVSKDASETKWITSVLNTISLTSELPIREYVLLRRYVLDMWNVLSETARVLKCPGKAVFVVGDSTVKGNFIRNSKIVSALAEMHGLTLYSEKTRELPPNRRYLPPPRTSGSSAFDGRMRQEVVLTFTK